MEDKTMNEMNIMTTAEVKEAAPTIRFQDGNTTIIIGLNFKKKAKVTLEDRLKDMIRADVKAQNF